LTVLDPGSGAVIHEEVIGSSQRLSRKEVTLVAASDDRLWLRDGQNGLHARDAHTGRLIATEAALAEKYPELKGSKAAEVVTPEGYALRIAPPQFILELVSWPPRKGPPGDETSFPLKQKDGVVLLDDTQGLSLRSKGPKDPEVRQLMHVRKQRYGYEPDACLNGALELRDGFIVTDRGLEQPRSLLIGHREFDSERKKRFALCRIGFDGAVLWELNEDAVGGDPSHFTLLRGTLFVAAAGRLTAVDPTSGQVRWQKRL
jgi:hypothetical protein